VNLDIFLGRWEESHVLSTCIAWAKAALLWKIYGISTHLRQVTAALALKKTFEPRLLVESPD
jgi:hypothetical protein